MLRISSPVCDEVFQRLDHGQARADGGFVQEVRARAAAQPLQVLVVRDGPAVGALVRRDDVNAARQPVRVAVRDTLVRRAIDEHRMRQVIRLNVCDELLRIHCDAFLERGAPLRKVEALLVEHHLLAAADRAQTQIQVELGTQRRSGARELVEQRAADEPGAEDADRYGLRR